MKQEEAIEVIVTKLSMESRPNHPMKTSYSFKRFLTAASVHLMAVMLTICGLKAQTLVNTNFDSLTDGDIAGQGGWVALSGAKTATILSGPAGSLDTSKTVGRNLTGGDTTPALIKNTGLFSSGSLSSSSIVTLTFDVYAAGANSISFYGIGAASYTGGPSAQFGVFNGAWTIRGENSGSITNAVNSSGTALSITTGSWYRVQSVWDLSANSGAGSATLSILNLTAGETDYTTLYFNAAQTQSTVSLGIASAASTWTSAYIRAGQNSGNGLAYLDNLSAVAIPEPAISGLVLLGMGLLAWRSRSCAAKSEVVS